MHPTFDKRILHVDMDAFYASIEQKEQPAYRHQPLIVARSAAQRGVVSACSYEARVFGIHAGMSTAMALKKCPGAVVVAPRLDLYKAVSATIMDVFLQCTAQMEPLAFDEAYLDVSEGNPTWTEVLHTAAELKRAVYERTQLTCSIGVSFSKFLAKLASSYQKPNGLTFFGPDNYQSYIEESPVAKFYGIGEVTQQQLQQLGIHTGRELLQLDEDTLVRLFKRRGRALYGYIRGIDERAVDNNRQRKSFGREHTFAHDVASESAELSVAMHQLAVALSERLVRTGTKAHRLMVKIKFADFSETTKRISLPQPTNDAALIEQKAWVLWKSQLSNHQAIRKVAVYALDFAASVPPTPQPQLSLF